MPPPAAPDTRPSLRGPPPPLPAIGIGFKYLSRRCRRDKLPYATAAGYIQHLNQQHILEEAHSLRLPNRLPDIVKCRDYNHYFCQNARCLQAHRLGPMHAGSVIPPVVDPTEIWIIPFFEKCTLKCTLFLEMCMLAHKSIYNRVKMSVHSTDLCALRANFQIF